MRIPEYIFFKPDLRLQSALMHFGEVLKDRRSMEDFKQKITPSEGEAETGTVSKCLTESSNTSGSSRDHYSLK